MLKLKLQSGVNNAVAVKRLQYIRSIIQLSILGILVAGLYGNIRSMLFFLLPLSFIAGNFFCGWVCPYGTAQDILGKIGSLFLKKKLKMPPQIQRFAQFFRYLLMAALVLLASRQAAEALPFNAYKSFMAFAGGRTIETVALVIMGMFLIISMFFERPFCNYVCSEGIKYSVASMTRIFTVKRNPATCVHCKKCDQACPMNIQVSASKDGRNGQCINCFHCIAACPVNNTLSYGIAGFPANIWHKLRGGSSRTALDMKETQN